MIVATHLIRKLLRIKNKWMPHREPVTLCSPLTAASRKAVLTHEAMFDILSDMKQISAREFQKRFGQIATSMREGQTLEVTMHGKPVGRFTKNRTRERSMPDFVSLLERESCPKELGNQILKEFDDSLS